MIALMKHLTLRRPLVWPILSILLIAATVRFFQLGTVPVGITHDEMGYIYNAYSIAKTGKNVFSETLPLFTWMTKGGFPFMPVPIYSMTPLFWLFPLTPFVARMLPALMGVADVALLYVIVSWLFRSPVLSALSAMFLAISPWHIHFARSAYDANFALFYFLVAIAAFLYEIRHAKLPWISSIAFTLAVFSYRGMSILFLPIGILLYWYARLKGTILAKQARAFGAGMMLCALLLFATIAHFGSAYTAEGAQLFSSPTMQQDLDAYAREARGPLILKRFFANKPTYIINRFRENYIKAYSPEFLFLYTEPSIIYSIWSRGRIYFIDAVFIILGLWYLLKLNPPSALLWIGFLLVGGLPGGIGGLPYSSRNFLLSAVFPVLSAAGVTYVLSLFRGRTLRFAVATCLVMLYTYAFGSYLFDYYYRYAYQSAEGWAKSIKDISSITQQKQDAYDNVIWGKTSFGDTVEYAFWTRTHPTVVQEAWKNRKQEPFVYFPLGSVMFSEKCLDRKDLGLPEFAGMNTALYITTHTCNNEATPSAKIQDFFGNPVWKIFELDRRIPSTLINL